MELIHKKDPTNVINSGKKPSNCPPPNKYIKTQKTKTITKRYDQWTNCKKRFSVKKFTSTGNGIL
jgi:hypothetical protein